MGTFIYNGTLTVDFEDRLLAHLQFVITNKLRRDESFSFSWTTADDSGGGRTSVWLDRRIPIVFDFSTSALPALNREWAESLMRTAHRDGRLQIVPETNERVAVSEKRGAIPANRT
ncbi:ATP-dependent DNA ligase [Leifsonia sp. YIM 134122]|uniref:ATP-dependent DNA ligase n=1 Tax=Leifsonia stereocauli TaxID=3134136 RepID=A0ABU9W209_9MICO